MNLRDKNHELMRCLHLDVIAGLGKSFRLRLRLHCKLRGLARMEVRVICLEDLPTKSRAKIALRLPDRAAHVLLVLNADDVTRRDREDEGVYRPLACGVEGIRVTGAGTLVMNHASVFFLRCMKTSTKHDLNEKLFAIRIQTGRLLVSDGDTGNKERQQISIPVRSCLQACRIGFRKNGPLPCLRRRHR